MQLELYRSSFPCLNYFFQQSAQFMHAAACFNSLLHFMSECKYSELFINPLIDIYIWLISTV